MKVTIKSAIITIVLGLIAGIAGMGLGHLLFSAPNVDTSLHGMVHHELTLTTEQHTQIDMLEASFAGRKNQLEQELRKANAELAAAILESEETGPKVEAAVRHFHDAMGSLQAETIDHIFAMRRVLTPEQRVTFDAQVKRALTADGQ